MVVLHYWYVIASTLTGIVFLRYRVGAKMALGTPWAWFDYDGWWAYHLKYPNWYMLGGGDWRGWSYFSRKSTVRVLVIVYEHVTDVVLEPVFRIPKIIKPIVVVTLRLNLTLVFDFGDSSDFGFKTSSSFSLTRLSISLPRAVVPLVKPGGPAEHRRESWIMTSVKP